MIVFINQLRHKIGVMYGNPEVTTGGNALKFYASIRVDIRRISDIKQGDNILGTRTRIKIVKNKIAPPFKIIELDIMFGEGISKLGSLLDLAVECDVIKKSGSWYSYGEERLGQGRENSKEFLMEHNELVEAIDREVRKHYDIPFTPHPEKQTKKEAKKEEKKEAEA